MSTPPRLRLGAEDLKVFDLFLGGACDLPAIALATGCPPERVRTLYEAWCAEPRARELRRWIAMNRPPPRPPAPPWPPTVLDALHPPGHPLHPASGRATPADVAAQIARVLEAFKRIDAPELRALLERLIEDARAAGLGASTLPLALVCEERVTRRELFEVASYSVQVPCRPEHLVLTPETARSFDLYDFQVGRRSQLPAPGLLPLDTFSVEYVGPGRLSELQRWKGDECPVGMAVRLVVRLRPEVEGAMFRGLLWCSVKLP